MRGPETNKSHAIRHARNERSFYARFMSGEGLDIGFRGETGDAAEPVLYTAIGVDLDYPGYNGTRLPFEDKTKDYVYASHVLEHLDQPYIALDDWFRVLKVGGHLVIAVPHMWLYEKKSKLPSRYNEDHKTFFTPATLMRMAEMTLPINGYRVRLLQDNDEGYDYSIPPEKHANGAYEIVLVIQKIEEPKWSIY